MEKAFVFNIQRFSIHDGDGIRSTIFFKGCGLRCRWCHNPESQSYEKQVMRYAERCTTCSLCMSACTNQAISLVGDKLVLDRDRCTSCGKCLDYCLHNALEMAGKAYTVHQLVEIVKRDRILYEESGGGVTLSGGEVMSQSIDFLLELCKKLKKIGISVAVDTCGLGPKESFVKVAPYVDAFLYDIKTLDNKKHQEFVGKGLEKILENLKEVNKTEAHLFIRIAVIHGFNEKNHEMLKIAQWLVDHNIKVQGIHLLPYHPAGSVKYHRLGRVYNEDGIGTPTESEMQAIKSIFMNKGFQNTQIGG